MAEFAALSSDELLDALGACERRLAAVQAEQLAILALLEQRPSSARLPGVEDKHWVREQVALVLNCSPEFAGHRLAQAERLARLPGALELLGEGKVSFAQLRMLADRTAGLDEQDAVAVAGRVLPNAAGQSYAAFGAALRRAVLTLAPKTESQERAHNISERRVHFDPAGAGVVSLWALLPEEQATAIAAELTSTADSGGPDDPRTADQRRADALVHLILNPDSTMQQPPARPALRPAINMCVALSTLLGVDDQPAELDGSGPIPAALARELAADPTGTWRRLVTDPTGQLIDYGRSTYEPPAALAEHVLARDRTCRYPHCTRRAVVRGRQTSDIDHRIAWADGGHANEANLHVLCPRHHHLKHETRTVVTRQPDGTTAWTDHRNRSNSKTPEQYPVDTPTAAQTGARARVRGSPADHAA